MCQLQLGVLWQLQNKLKFFGYFSANANVCFTVKSIFNKVIITGSYILHFFLFQLI